CSPKTLRKRCRDDLDRGVAEANAIVPALCLPRLRAAISRHRFSGSNHGRVGGNATRRTTGLQTATTKQIHRWSSCCPKTGETRSWSVFERIISSQNAGAEVAHSSTDCNGALCRPEHRAGALATGPGFAGAAEQITSLFEA